MLLRTADIAIESEIGQNMLTASVRASGEIEFEIGDRIEVQNGGRQALGGRCQRAFGEADAKSTSVRSGTGNGAADKAGTGG